jgi:uncharacterized membrane protein
MAIPEFVKSVLEPWSSLYQGSKVLISLARFLHLAGVLIGGGAAVAADRASIQALGEGPDFRSHHLAMLRRVHRVIIGGLVLIAVSGLMMVAADLEVLAELRVFWIKMVLVALLLANGLAITRIERRLQPGMPTGWTALGVTSRISFFLWFAIILASAVLVLVA